MTTGADVPPPQTQGGKPEMDRPRRPRTCGRLLDAFPPQFFLKRSDLSKARMF